MSPRPPRSLRVRLVALVVLLSAVGLLVAGLVSTALLRGYLTDRVDEQLLEATRPVVAAPPSVPDVPGGPVLPGRFFVQLVSADGRHVEVLSVPRGPDAGTPSLPSPTLAAARAAAGTITTVPSVDGGSAWRAVVVPLRDGTGSLTFAASLSDVEATVTRLVWLQVVIGLVVLVAVGGLAYVLVRRSLRPLAEVERVAGEIAAGDLTRRVPGADARTEVGQLATAFNTMVDRIEVAFDAQAASEATARESEQRMRRFVADASHELRTPLTSIRGFAELHRQGAVAGPDQVAHAMGRIEDEAARMGLLVEDLLLLARLDQQRPLDLAPVDLVSVAAEVVHDAGVVAPARTIALHVADGGWPPVVLGDEPRLRQVVSNLVGNALRHTPPEARIDVRVGVEGAAPGPDGRVVLEVRDTGPGLPPDVALRVFERFYRADSSRSRGDGGTGLGLAIVAALVQAHGGRVELDTEPGRGAAFRVVLPAAPVGS